MINPRDWVTSLLAVVANREPLFIGLLWLLSFVFATISVFLALKGTAADIFRLQDLKPNIQAVLGVIWIAAAIGIVFCIGSLLLPFIWRNTKDWYNAPLRFYYRLQRGEQAICLGYFLGATRSKWLLSDNFDVLSLREKGVLELISSSGDTGRYDLRVSFWRVLGPDAASLIEEFGPKSEELKAALRMMDRASPSEHSWMSR